MDLEVIMLNEIGQEVKDNYLDGFTSMWNMIN